jgi:hypothetical protein
MPVRKTLILALALLLLSSAGATAMRVNWTVSGVAVQHVALEGSAPEMALFQVEAKGSPGAAKIIGLNRSFLPSLPANDMDGCFEGADLKLTGGLNENSLVAVFQDGSLLNMLREPGGFACIEFATGRFYAEVPIYFNGGFGRFGNATGTALIRIHAQPVGRVDVAPGVSEHSILMGEYGTIEGRIQK